MTNRKSNFVSVDNNGLLKVKGIIEKEEKTIEVFGVTIESKTVKFIGHQLNNPKS